MQEVKGLQNFLNNHGLTDDSEKTLSVDRSIGPKTQQAIQKYVFKTYASKPDKTIRDMQEMLQEFGYKNPGGTPLTADSIHGPKTDAAINDFKNKSLPNVDRDYTSKTVQKTALPTTPGAGHADLAAAITPGTSSKGVTEPWEQTAAYTDRSALQGTQDPFTTATQKLMQSLQAQKNEGDTQTPATLPVQTNKASGEMYADIYGRRTIQTQERSGQSSQDLLDMILEKQKAGGANTQKNSRLNDSGYRLAEENIEDALKRPQETLDDLGYKIPGSGQDSGYKPGRVEDSNRFFNEYNRNAGLDKSRVTLPLSEVKAEDTGDQLNQIYKGASDFIKNSAETVQNAAGTVISQTPFKMHYRKADPNNPSDPRNDTWYSTKDGVQQWMGYSNTYDDIYKVLGFNIQPKIVEFSYVGKTYRFEVWYGSYGIGTMIPGAESGLYVKDNRQATNPIEAVTQGLNAMLNTEHFNVVSKSDQLGMRINLYHKDGNMILSADSADTEADGKTFWQFASKPSYGPIDASDMKMSGTLRGDYFLLKSLMEAAAGDNELKFFGLQPISGTSESQITYTYKAIEEAK